MRLERQSAIEDVGDLLVLPAACADDHQTWRFRVLRDETTPDMQEEQMVFARLDCAKGYEIGMALGTNCRGLPFERRRKRLDLNRAGALAQFAKLPLESRLNCLARDEKHISVSDRRREAAAEDDEVRGGEIFREVNRQQIVEHENGRDVVAPVEPIEKERMFEEMLRDVEIDPAVGRPKRTVMKEPAAKLAPIQMQSACGFAVASRNRHAISRRDRERFAQSTKDLASLAGPQGSGERDEALRLLIGKQMRAPQTVVDRRCARTAHEMAGIGEIDAVDAR